MGSLLPQLISAELLIASSADLLIADR